MIRPSDLTDEDFIEFSRSLRREMDALDGAAWQNAQDLRDDCRIGRLHNNQECRRRVAEAINARNGVKP